MPVTSVKDFRRLLEKSTLLTAEQLAEFKTWPEEEPKTLLARMVKAGWITLWQSQQLLAGKSNFFIGRYKLLELIGQGGMGAVFKAEQPPIARIVALKVMNRQILKQPKSVTRFLREIRSAAAVDHPNLVRAFDADVDRDTYFLVMEFVAGRNLKSWIKAEQSLPIGWSCECIRQAALGLEHAFEQGMVHRDIKPSNLLVTDDEHNGLPLVKILDLGLARFASETEDAGDLTRSGQVLGTPDYIAPEQARSTRTADIRADIFSLGCTLFELLTGRLPFPGTTVMEKLMARASQDAFRVRLYRPDVPIELDAIVARMLARDPQMRYPTPADVAHALAPYAIGTASEIRAPAPVASNEAGLSTSGSPAGTSGGFDVTTDAMLPGFADVLRRAAAEKSAHPQSSLASRIRRDPRLRIAAVVVAAVVVLGVVLSLLPGKKGAPADGAARQERPAQKQKNDVTDEPDSRAGDADENDERDPQRQAALWVLERRGTLSIAVGPETQSSGKAQRRLTEVRAAGELSSGTFRVIEVAIPPDVDLREADFARLAKLTHLKSLSLAGTRFADGDLAPLKNVESLRRLDLDDTPLSNAGLKLVAKLPNLEVLSLDRTRVSGAVLEILRSSKSLTELSLEGTAVTDPDLRHLTEMSQLLSLNLAQTQVKGRGLSSLRTLKELTHLDLGGLPMQGNALINLRGMAHLRYLRLTGSRVTDADLTMLSSLTGLRELMLGRTGVSGSGLKSLTWMGQLERLDLQETGVGDDGLKVLRDAKSLKSLNLHGTVVSDKGTEQLRAMSQLEFLDLSGTRVTPERISALRKTLPGCQIED